MCEHKTDPNYKYGELLHSFRHGLSHFLTFRAPFIFGKGRELTKHRFG